MPRAYRAGSRRLLALGIPGSFVRVREELRARGLLTPLAERCLRQSAAHAEHPASIGYHRSYPGGLIEHRSEVLANLLVDLAAAPPTDIDRTALLVMGAIHDAGKSLSFQVTARGRWEQRDKRHAQRTAAVLQGIPEAERELGEDLERVYLALKHEHTPERIPVRLRKSCDRLIARVKVADKASAEAGESSEELRVAALARAVSLFASLIQDTRVNRVKSARLVQGFYEVAGSRGEEVLFLSEQYLRQKLDLELPDKEAQALGLWRDRPRGDVHEGFAAVARELIAKGAIPDSARGVSSQPGTGLMTIASGKRFYRAVFPVSLAWLRQSIGEDEVREATELWRTGDQFEIWVLAEGYDKSDDELEAILKAKKGTEEAAREALEFPLGRCPACGKPLKLEGGNVQCADYTAPPARKCNVRFRVRDGAPVKVCERCGKDLIVVPVKPPFMGCPDKCRDKPPGSGGQP
jgi:hypothetical protein